MTFCPSSASERGRGFGRPHPAKMAFLLLLALSTSAFLLQGKLHQSEKALKVIDSAVQVLGGDAFLKVKTIRSSGRYFRFDKYGRSSGLIRFHDWTVLEPVKWRFQLGEGNRQFLQVYNLELMKGWTLEGKEKIKEIPEKGVHDFAKSARGDVELLLRGGKDREGMSIFYYGPDDIEGSGEWEAVEFLDATNNSVVIYFDRDSHLPVKSESHFIGKLGLRHKQETEFYNWHEIQGVNTALRLDGFVDGKKSDQRFIEELAYNESFPPEYFQEPQPEK